MSESIRFGDRTYEFALHCHRQDAEILWGDGWDEEGDQEAFENEMTARGIDWNYDLEAFQDDTERAAQQNYIEAQFDLLEDNGQFPFCLKVIGSNGTETNWMNCSPEQAEKIKRILYEG